jgi:PBP1b-binding outer membrane lipoprotein LpoB
MQLRRLTGLLIASVSASSLLFAGCSRQRNFDEVQPTPQQPTPNVPTQKRKADVPFA